MKTVIGYEPIVFNGVEFIQYSDMSYSTVDGLFGICVHCPDDVEVSVYCEMLKGYMYISQTFESLESAMAQIVEFVKSGVLDGVTGICKNEG